MGRLCEVRCYLLTKLKHSFTFHGKAVKAGKDELDVHSNYTRKTHVLTLADPSLNST